MDSKTKEKKEYQILFDNFKIQVCKDPQLQGFLNVFHLKGEHIEQEKIGEVFGIIQAHDHSQQSNYLPNIIVQVLKKEFFRLPKRNCQESLEAALHKVNAALGDLVQDGNTGWIGKLDAVVGAFKDKSFSFSQTGKAKIFFIRNKKLTEITRGLDEQNENPIKTFSNVSSGGIEVDDKIIFATESIHESLSTNDLSRHINTFNSDEFDNLLSSTIQTEGENVGTFVVNIRKKEVSRKEKQQKKSSNKNYFGSDKPEKEEKGKIEIPKEKKEVGNKINQNSGKPTVEKPELANGEDVGKMREALSKELSTELDALIKKEEAKELLPIQKTDNKEIVDKAEKDCKEKKEILFPSKKDEKKLVLNETKGAPQREKSDVEQDVLSPFEEQPELFINDDESEEIEKKLEERNSLHTKISAMFSGFFSKDNFSKNFDKIKEQTKNKSAALLLKKNPLSKKSEKPEKIFENRPKEEESQKLKKFWNKKEDGSAEKTILGSIKIGLSHLFKNATPETSAQRRSRPKNKKTLVILGAVFVIFMLIFGIIKITGRGGAPEEVFSEENGNLSTENQISLNKKEGEIFDEVVKFQKAAAALTSDNGNLYALTTEGSFYEYDIHNGSAKEISIKEDDAKSFNRMVAMDDLNLIFFLSDNEIISYNRVTGNFEKQSIDFPENMDLLDIGTKTTYLYLADKESGQIYRYPRSESTSFAKPKIWLNTSTDFSKAASMTIDDSIYIGYSDGKIEKYFKSKLEKSFLIESDQKMIPNKMTTMENFDYYYILDWENGIVAKISKNNNQVEKKYQAETFKEAKDILLEPGSKNVFVLTRKSLLKLK